MDKPLLTRTLKVLLFFILAIAILYLGREFLIPVALAGLLAMLFLPLNNRLERAGLPRVLAGICCILTLLIVIGGLGALLGWQVSSLAEDMTGIKTQATETLAKVREKISETMGISPEKQEEMVKKQQESGGGDAAKTVSAVLGGLMSMLVNTILVLVYIFLFIYFRGHFKKFILKLVPASEKKETEKVIKEASQVAQKYLAGLGMMIVMLWVLYGIGYSIIGVKHALFFAVLCGILEIIPFIGNLAGTAVTVLMTVAQGGDSTLIVGVLVTYAIVQFVQTYILEPLVVGAEVNINPVFTILALVAAEMVWGIPGMILAIPLLGIVKIICDHVEPLKPYGFLLGPPEGKQKENKLKVWIKSKVSRNQRQSG